MRGVGMHQWRMLFQWAVLTLFAVAGVHAQEKPAVYLDPSKGAIQLRTQSQTQTPTARRSITVDEAVEIFMRQNLQLVAARYDIETADAEKLTARLRPNPQLTFGLADIPVNLRGPLIKEQTYDYGISRPIELGGKRSKRIETANANSDVAPRHVQTVVLRLTKQA